MSKTSERIRVLHLEDSPHDAELITHRLESGGLDVDVVRVDNYEVMETELDRGEYDLFLCDYNLPGYDGASAIKLVREKQPHLPVIVISGSMGEEEAVECLHKGATDYLLKQRLERLVPAIRRALEEASMQKARSQAEEKLRDSEERFRQLAEQSSEGFWFIGLNPEKVLYVSPSLSRMWDRPAEYFYRSSRAWIDFIHPDDRPAVAVDWERCLTGKLERFDLVYRIILPDESVRWILACGGPIRDTSGNVLRLGGIVRDITERKLIETQMLRAQRLESIGTLAGGIAHDLNNTLVPILMSTGLLRMKYPDETEMIDSVETSARRAANMIKQLLTYARGIEGARLAVRPEDLMAELTKIIRSAFPKNIELRVVVTEPLSAVLGDVTQLHQVLLNLCVNARDAMPHGGTLILEAQNVELSQDNAIKLGRPDARPGNYVVLHVRDTGVGIPEGIQERIFEPFFSTKSPDKGTGLGLSTVIGIVKSHGGFVHVKSATQQGSVFSVYLPIAQNAATVVLEDLPPEEEFRGNGETILIVDDESAVRDIYAQVLTALNFHALTAPDGTAALAMAAEYATELKVVITDVHMPNVDGLTFVLVLQRMLPRTEIVVTSGHMEASDVASFNSLGIYNFLDKPFNQQQLVKVLKDVLGRSSV